MSYHPIQGQNGYGRNPSVRRMLCISNLSQLDAGMHPALDGIAALPWFDEFDLSTIDVLLISQ